MQLKKMLFVSIVPQKGIVGYSCVDRKPFRSLLYNHSLCIVPPPLSLSKGEVESSKVQWFQAYSVLGFPDLTLWDSSAATIFPLH